MTAEKSLEKHKSRTISEYVLDRKDKIVSLLPRHVDVDRFAKSALMAVSRSRTLQRCSVDSVFTAILNAAELGLDFTPAKGHAYLVPYKNQATFMPGYRGMIQLASNSGIVKKVEAHAVYENDKFDIEYGTNPHLTHKPTLTGDTGATIGAYAVAWYTGSNMQMEFMTIEQIEHVRKSAKTDNVWKDYYDEMCRKTVVRRLFKYLPASTDEKLTKALEYDNEIAGVADESDDRSQADKLVDIISDMGEEPEDAEYEEAEDENLFGKEGGKES